MALGTPTNIIPASIFTGAITGIDGNAFNLSGSTGAFTTSSGAFTGTISQSALGIAGNNWVESAGAGGNGTPGGNNGAVGGNWSATAGAGGIGDAGSMGGNGGAGGTISLTGGAGGVRGGSFNPNYGVGGSVSIFGGASGGGNISGGSITIDSGAKSGSGTSAITVGASNATSIGVGNNSASTTITGTFFIGSFQINPSGAVANQSLVYNGTAFVPVYVSQEVGSKSTDLQLTTTLATTVATFTPSTSSNYVVYIYYRVVTASTNLTLTLTWTDGSGAQSDTIIPLASQTVGSYIIHPTYINSTANTITVSATAGTANNIYVSANILGI